MRRILVILLSCAGLALLFAVYRFLSKPTPLNRAASEIERFVTAENIRNQIQNVAAKPHRAGTPENKVVGDAIIRRLKSAGLEVSTTEYEVSLPEPLQSNLTLLFPQRIEFEVKEKVFSEDPYSQIASSDMPYFAFSPDADIEAEVIYANFGSKQDYEFLKQQGIDPAGKIVLVRAQGICRGMKLLYAEEQGVAGLLLFPELRDQGFNKTPYPEGPHINPWVIQRGSMLKFFLYPGEPSADFMGKNSTLPRIPSLPISQEIAMQLLKRIEGPAAPKEWHGWLPVPYPLGAGPARVRLVVQSKNSRATIRNIFATIRGSNPLESEVLAGGHYDAWVYGAADPSSGTTVLLEAAEALSRLNKSWWKPKRTLMFAFWDAEEFGLFGSTKWVESAMKQSTPKVAAYINVDTAVKGQDFAGYVMPGLQAPLDQVLGMVHHPMTGEFLSERRGEFVTPGFSDDTGPFTGIAGVPVAEIHFGRYYPMYHSIYDDLNWMEKFNDPDYKLSAALAKVLSLYLLKLSGDEIFPYQFTEVSQYTRRSCEDILAGELNYNPSIAKQKQTLLNAMERYDQSASSFQEASHSKKEMNARVAEQVNQLVSKAIASFVRPHEAEEAFSGYATRNMLLGTSEVDGCAGQQLPGLKRAVQSGDMIRIEAELKRLTDAFNAATTILLNAVSILRQ